MCGGSPFQTTVTQVCKGQKHLQGNAMKMAVLGHWLVQLWSVILILGQSLQQST